MKYLLSSGKTTDRIEHYVMDLIKLNLSIFPGDIPGMSDLGIDFIFTGTQEDELVEAIKDKCTELVDKIKSRLPGKVLIYIEGVEILDSRTLRLTVTVNNTTGPVDINMISTAS